MACEKRRSKKTRMRLGDSAEQPETASNQKLHQCFLCTKSRYASNYKPDSAQPEKIHFEKGAGCKKKIDARGPGSESAVSLHRRSRSPPLMQRGPITLSPQISDQGGSRSSRRASSSAPPPRRSRRTRSRRTRSRWRPACPACCRPPVPQSSSHRPCQYLS